MEVSGWVCPASGNPARSRNATTHGCFSTLKLAITRGAFAEDPVALAAFIEVTVDDLEPHDSIERFAAQDMTYLTWKARRLLFQSTSVSDAGSEPDALHPGRGRRWNPAFKLGDELSPDPTRAGPRRMSPRKAC